MFDLLLRGGLLPTGERVDIAISAKKIVEIAPHIVGEAVKTIDISGRLVSPPFVDSHFHLDSAMTVGMPRYNESGTLLEGIAIWNELRPSLTFDAIKKRAIDVCHWAIARGTLAIRSHVDVCDDSLLAVEALLEVRKSMAKWIDIQLVAFPQMGLLRSANAETNLLRALDKGVDVVGGIPHFERTMNDGATSVQRLCKIAAERGLLVDMHCDESDDPSFRHVERLVAQTVNYGLYGRVTGSHLTSMHSMDNYYVSKLIPLMREAELHVVANPLINITLQGRHDSYPKRRGMTRVKELMVENINVAFGHDSVMDPWYSLGSHDMLEVAHMGLHVAQMTGHSEMKDMFSAITINGAKVMALDNYGVEVGCDANLIVLQASDPIDALRMRSQCLYVIRHGEVIASSRPVEVTLNLDGKTTQIDFSH